MAYFNLRRVGKDRIADLSRAYLESLNRFIDRSLLEVGRYAVNINLNIDVTALQHFTVLGHKLVNLKSVTSKNIREGRTTRDPICIFKCGLINTPAETINWANKLNKLTSTKLKNVLLRVAHREYYPKERLHRYRLIDSPNCSRCDQIEDYDHKVYNCSYVKKIWAETFKLTDKAGVLNQLCFQSQVLGTSIGTDSTVLTVHAEVLNRILLLRDEANHLMRPISFVKQAIEYLIRKERGESRRNKIKNLLAED